MADEARIASKVAVGCCECCDTVFIHLYAESGSIFGTVNMSAQVAISLIQELEDAIEKAVALPASQQVGHA